MEAGHPRSLSRARVRGAACRGWPASTRSIWIPRCGDAPELAVYPRLGVPVSVRLRRDRRGHGRSWARVWPGAPRCSSGPRGRARRSLINRLVPGAELRVSEVSERTQKGRHTTTWVEMLDLDNGGHLVDSPGLRVLDLSGLEPEDLVTHFPEMAALGVATAASTTAGTWPNPTARSRRGRGGDGGAPSLRLLPPHLRQPGSGGGMRPALQRVESRGRDEPQDRQPRRGGGGRRPGGGVPLRPVGLDPAPGRGPVSLGHPRRQPARLFSPRFSGRPVGAGHRARPPGGSCGGSGSWAPSPPTAPSPWRRAP